jgi:hypothetical protein
MYQEIYCWTHYYLRGDKSKSTLRISAFCALLAFIISQGLNLLTVLAFLKYLSVFDVFSSTNAFEIGIIIFTILLALNYRPLYVKREEIFSKYNHITPERLERGKSLLWYYYISSIALFFIVVILLNY